MYFRSYKAINKIYFLSQLLLLLYFVYSDCPNNAFGIDYSKKKIPDAQLSAHYTLSTRSASDGRLNSRSGWIGTGAGSWLQV